MSNITKKIAFALTAFSFLALPNSEVQAQQESAVAIASTNNSTENSMNNSGDQARFPGCESEGSNYSKIQCAEAKLDDFIKENLSYPSRSKSADFNGKVVKVSFIVEPTGIIHSFKIIRPDIKEYDVNALAVFEKMVESGIKWVPAEKDGGPARSNVTKTVHYDIEGRDIAYPAAGLGNDVYELVDEVPAFASCQSVGKKDREILDCTFESLDGFFRENMIYPEDALEVGLEGDINVEFIIDAKGLVRNVKIQDDLGLGTSEEAFRLMLLMNDKNIGWIPGEEDGKRVNVRLNTTVHFRIDASAKPKSKLKLMDAKPVFVTEREGFDEYMESNLKYPTGEDIDPCKNGVIDVKFKVNGSGAIEITKMTDYNELGKEFKASATNFINSTKGDWNTGYANLNRNTEYYLSIPYAPNTRTCPLARDDYRDMVEKALEGEKVAKEKANLNDGLKLLDDALRLFPADNKFRYLRGTTLYRAGRRIEGCVDLSFVNKQNKDIVVPKSCK